MARRWPLRAVVLIGLVSLGVGACARPPATAQRDDEGGSAAPATAPMRPATTQLQDK